MLNQSQFLNAQILRWGHTADFEENAIETASVESHLSPLSFILTV